MIKAKMGKNTISKYCALVYLKFIEVSFQINPV